jgi:hypothetical protein
MRLYEFEAELAGYKPRIYRRFGVRGDCTASWFCYCLMTMFEMHARSPFFLRLLHQTPEESQSFFYALPDMFVKNKRANYEMLDGDAITLEEMNLLKSDDLLFIYLQNHWQLNLIVKTVSEADNSDPPIMIFEGSGFGVIDDLNGPEELTRLMQAYQDAEGEDYEKYVEQYGEYIDLETFDMEDINQRLQIVPRIIEKIYKKQEIQKLSEYELSYLNRDYGFLATLMMAGYLDAHEERRADA